MMLFQKKKASSYDERLFRLFISGLAKKGFDVKVFNKEQIIEHIGRGYYGKWKECFVGFRYHKIVLCADDENEKTSWPSDTHLDRLVINLVRAPSIEPLLKAEKELLELLEMEKKK